MTEKVISIGGHSRMTPEEALDVSSRVNWKSVVILGCDQDDNYVLHCSDLTRAEILYYLKTAELDMMQPALAVLANQGEEP